MSHYDFNSGDESRKNVKGDFQQPNTEESELKFEENEVQFIPVDLHDEKPPFKYSGDLSKPESEKYYSNAELRTIQKFNSLFNKVVVLPSNTLCGRTGASFSNGDYGDVSVKEEFWKTTEEELVHYEENSNSDQTCKKTCNKVKCNCKRPSNLYFSQKSTASNLRLERHESSKKEMQSANTVVFRKLPDVPHFHQSHNVDAMPICGHINEVEFSNELYKPCAKRGTVDDQRSTSMKHRCFSREEVKLESRESDNIDSISFCGNTLSPNDMKPYKPYGVNRTGKTHKCMPMKYGCFSSKEMKVEICESKNIDAISHCRKNDDLESSNNVTPCKQYQRSGIFTADRGESIENRYFCGNGVKAEPCESDRVDSITPCGNINKSSLNNVKLCKRCEKTKPVGTQIIYRPFSMKEVEMETCKFSNGDSIPICENINKVEFCDDVKIYKSCERSTMVEPQNTAIIHSCFSGQCAKSEIRESNNTDKISVLKNANQLVSCKENKRCEPCKKRGTTFEAQGAVSTKHRCLSKEEMKFDSCKFENPQTFNETKECKCSDFHKNLPNVNKGEMIKKCNLNRSNPQVSNNCDSSTEKLPLKNCPRIRLSKADQKVCAYENAISPSKFITPQVSPSTSKAAVKLQMSHVTPDVEEATAKTESALLDEKLCRKFGSPDLTKSCTCTMYSPTFIPIYYANTERISCFSFSEKETCSDEETDYTKSLPEETDIENTSPQNPKTETQIVTGISSIKTSISRQRINEEERIFAEVSGVLTHDTTVFNFIEILTRSEQKFMPNENERQFVNKKEESEDSTLDSDLSEYHKKEIVDSVADNSASSSDIERCYLENRELGSKQTILMSNKKSIKICNKQKMKKKKEFLNNYEKQRSIIMRKRIKTNNKQTPTSTPSSEKNVKKIREVISEYLDTSSTSILNNYKFSNTKKSKLVLPTSKHIMNSKQVSSKGRTMSVGQKATNLVPRKKENFYSPYRTNPTLYHVAVKSVENINQGDAPNQKTKFRIAFFFKKSKGKIVNWFRYLHTTKQNVNLNDNNNGKNDEEADRALAATVNLIKQRKILSSKLRQTDSQTSKLYLYNKFYEEKGRTELIISKSEIQPKPVLQEIKSHEIIVPSLENELGEEESGGDQKDEEKLAGPSVPSEDSSVLFIRKEVYDRLQRYGKLHYTLYIGEKNELDHISIESLAVSEEKIKCDDQPFFASFDLGTNDVLVHVTKDTIDKMEDEEVKEAVFKDENYVACENSQVRLSLMRGAKYLQKLDPTQANIIEIDCSNKLHEIKICYKKVEHSKTCICEYPQACKNIQLESSDLSSIVIEKIDKILDAREVCENCERCKEKTEICDDYQECSDEKCAMKRDDYGELNFESQLDNELKIMDTTKHMKRVEYEEISIKSSECCDAVCSKKLAKNMENEEEDNVKTIQFMQVTQRCGFQEEICPETVGRELTSELQKEHKGDICVNNDKEKQIDLLQLNHISQKPDSLQKRDLQKHVTSKLGSKMTFRKNENQKSPVSKRKKMQKRNSQRYNNNHKPTLILTLTHYKSILNIRC
ncbi:hypothetical protein WA026_010992 [Henosepilachna vigintioctopunctata]|uniref:Uncharacterized protein n=1 Tax=Henosepilachna vigintioctopunctata TaxID=420089 RepID=A0AAW1UQP8_9CUCU